MQYRKGASLHRSFTRMIPIALATLMILGAQFQAAMACDKHNDPMSSSWLMRRVKLQESDPSERQPQNVIAVIVSIRDSSSYDPLYETIPQKSSQGQIPVYLVSTNVLRLLHDHLQIDLPANAGIEHLSLQQQQDFRQLLQDIASVDPESVLFNWECSASYGDHGFVDNQFTLQFLQFAINSKYSSVFSDFSLKALIAVWTNPAYSELTASLGACPLVQVGTFGHEFKLRFDSRTMSESGNAQLEKVANLVGEGEAHVHAMGGTILYTVNKSVSSDPIKSAPYDVSVLSVITEAQHVPASVHVNRDSDKLINLREFEGLAGHVSIQFESGGNILCSAGHWIELSKLDTTIERLVEVARMEKGEAYADELESTYSKVSYDEQQELLRAESKSFILSAASVKYSKKSNG